VQCPPLSPRIETKMLLSVCRNICIDWQPFDEFLGLNSSCSTGQRRAPLLLSRPAVLSVASRRCGLQGSRPDRALSPGSGGIPLGWAGAHPRRDLPHARSEMVPAGGKTASSKILCISPLFKTESSWPLYHCFNCLHTCFLRWELN